MWSLIKHVKQKLSSLLVPSLSLENNGRGEQDFSLFALAGRGAVLLSDTDKLENKGWTTNNASGRVVFFLGKYSYPWH